MHFTGLQSIILWGVLRNAMSYPKMPTLVAPGMTSGVRAEVEPRGGVPNPMPPCEAGNGWINSVRPAATISAGLSTWKTAGALIPSVMTSPWAYPRIGICMAGCLWTFLWPLPFPVRYKIFLLLWWLFKNVRKWWGKNYYIFAVKLWAKFSEVKRKEINMKCQSFQMSYFWNRIQYKNPMHRIFVHSRETAYDEPTNMHSLPKYALE